MDNKLMVNLENGTKEDIEVLDIIDSSVFKKTFIIYITSSDQDKIYASILNEKESSYSLDKIENQDEINYISSEVQRVIDELKS